MGLSPEIISQFAKVVNRDKKQNTESTIYGTVVDKQGHKPGDVDDNGNTIVIDEEGGKYIKPDGSDQLIPITDTEEDPAKANTATNTNYGDRASVLIKNHTATVTGNISAPSASNKDVETKITEFDIAVGEQIQANKAYFKDLTADKANLGNLVAAIISVAELIAKDADIENLVADNATVTDLIAKKIDADVVIADNAIIEHLKASTIDVLSLIADKAVIEDLIANDADLNSVEAKNAYLKYANVDFSNIGEAAITKLFSESGIIEDLVVSEGKITGELVGVTIKGDLIEAGTLKADRLVVKGSDGNYYALSTDFTAMPGVTPVEEDSIHGSVLIKKSIVAEKIAVDDLVAFGATIGGFKIGEKVIYSGVKESVDNTTRGIYMDTDGQFAVGDGDNYIKYGKDKDGKYSLDISVVDKLEIGGRNLIKFDQLGTVFCELSGNNTNDIKVDNVLADQQSVLTISGSYEPGEYTLNATCSVNGKKFRLLSSTAFEEGFTYNKYYDEHIGGCAYFKEVELPITFTLSEDTIFGLVMRSGNSTHLITELKLEKGSKATDWTPAPEDLVTPDELVSATDELNSIISEKIASLEVNANGIVASVSSLENRTNGKISDLNDTINELRNEVSLAVTEDSVQIEIQKAMSDGVTKVDTGTGFTFDEKGLTVNKVDSYGNPVSQTNTNIDENGMTVRNNADDEPVLTADKDGVDAKNLHATTYLIIGKDKGRSRFEDYINNGNNRTGCFWIGG